MGMGEPFRNYDAVLGAARRIMKDLGVGARHITISTVGLVPEIRRFADECAETGLEIKLAISLHESSDEKRSAIMPVNRKHDLDELIDACHYYVKQSGRRISFEWALIAGQNDDAASALSSPGGCGLKCHESDPAQPDQGLRRPADQSAARRGVHRRARQERHPGRARAPRNRHRRGLRTLADAASKEKAAERLAAAAKSAAVQEA